VVFRRAAVQHSNEERAGTLHAEQIASDCAQAASVFATQGPRSASPEFD